MTAVAGVSEKELLSFTMMQLLKCEFKAVSSHVPCCVEKVPWE